MTTATPTVARLIAALPRSSTRHAPSASNVHMHQRLDTLATKPLLRQAISAEGHPSVLKP